ncbi:DUF397 domain-containing protein [Streptomonospora salina]|uniref:DUF397 domain-containing protein n=1 Tax=Streptomonospora salina TaxID=104205 RepID=A0A841E986_9ACTN|nr:DUF397 domain-containing protein [Streptomonospora salina]MBB5999566.1 hypothetical protein [Streptomonospora salina]
MDLPTQARAHRLAASGRGPAGDERAHAGLTPSTARFRKSSYSFRENCVEVANDPRTGVAVRDSAHAAAAHLTFARPAWTALLGLVKAGRL